MAEPPDRASWQATADAVDRTMADARAAVAHAREARSHAQRAIKDAQSLTKAHRENPPSGGDTPRPSR